MKKLLPILILAALFVGIFSACAGAGSDNSAVESTASMDVNNSGGTAENGAPQEDALSTLTATPSQTADFAEKMIYTAYAELETIDFEKTISSVYAMLEPYGAFIQSSYISGQNYESRYYGYQTYRHAEFTLRVPVDSFEKVQTEISNMGNVISLSSDAENITTQFYDTQSRLNTYRTEEERLLKMLEAAETVSDMIEIESRLSDVRYEIESLTTTLQNWQNQVDYSTITLSIYEVEKLSESVSAQRTYWQEIGDGLKATMEGMGEFFKGLFKGLVIFLPVLLLLAVLAAAALACFFAVRRKKRAKKNIAEETEDPNPKE